MGTPWGFIKNIYTQTSVKKIFLYSRFFSFTSRSFKSRSLSKEGSKAKRLHILYMFLRVKWRIDFNVYFECIEFRLIIYHFSNIGLTISLVVFDRYSSLPNQIFRFTLILLTSIFWQTLKMMLLMLIMSPILLSMLQHCVSDVVHRILVFADIHFYKKICLYVHHIQLCMSIIIYGWKKSLEN